MGNNDTTEADFYSEIAKLAEEEAAEIEKATKGMTEIERKEYFLAGAREHLEILHSLKAAKFLIEQAERRIARLTKELAELQDARLELGDALLTYDAF